MSHLLIERKRFDGVMSDFFLDSDQKHTLVMSCSEASKPSGRNSFRVSATNEAIKIDSAVRVIRMVSRVYTLNSIRNYG